MLNTVNAITYFTSKRYKDHYYVFINNNILLINIATNKVDLVTDKYTLNQIHNYKHTEVNNDLVIFKLRYLVNEYLLNSIDQLKDTLNKYTDLHKLINNVNY